MSGKQLDFIPEIFDDLLADIDLILQGSGAKRAVDEAIIGRVEVEIISVKRQ